jgi:hypothetical protein
MSTPAAPNPVPTSPKTGEREITIYSHSGLFYWWPVWLFGFLFALWTYVESNRLAIVSPDAKVIKKTVQGKDGQPGTHVHIDDNAFLMTSNADPIDEKDKANLQLGVGEEAYTLKPRISAKPWMGPIFLIILCMVIMITNIPLRGLWSLVTIITLVSASLLISLLGWWDKIFNAFFGLHIYINMAGYLFLSTVLLIGWLLAVLVFDKRSYIVFTPGQVKVCEQVGGREKVYDSTGMTVEKHRDDWFRHIFLGFGTGDLSVRTAGADRHEILMPNVALIGFKIGPIERLIRERQTQIQTPPT